MIRVAILGAGIGEKHLDGYMGLPERFTVINICDLDTARASGLAARADAEVSSDYKSLLGDPHVDLIDICLPPAMHVPVALEALDAGKHVILEKPIAGSLADADRLVAAEAKAKGRVFPVFQYRYGRAFDQIAALADAGLLGHPQVATLETHWNRGADYYAIPWRGTWAYEMGGAVLSHAIHAHDLIARLFGPIRSVSAMLATRVNSIETEDCAAILMECEGGALVTSSITLGAADDTSRFRLVFADATVESAREPYAPGEAEWRVTARDPARQAEFIAVVSETPPEREGFAGYLEDVADAIDGMSTAVTLEEGRASIELVTAIYEAHRTGARVSLPFDRSRPIVAGLAP